MTFHTTGIFFYFDGTKAGEIKNGPKIKIDQFFLLKLRKKNQVKIAIEKKTKFE